MADAVFSFELEGSSEPALKQADALEQVTERIRENMAAMAGMRSAFNALKNSAYANSSSFKTLKDRMAATKAAIANSHAEFLNLGGDFKKLRKPAQDATSGVDTFLAKIKSSGGPLAGLQDKLAGIRALGARGLLAAGFAGIAVALVAVAAAAVAAGVALFKYGVAAADARRAELLQLEGISRVRNWYGLAADKAGFMQGAIDKVSGSSALARDKIAALSNGLQQAGLRGSAYESALQGLAAVSSVAGDAQADMYKALYMGARGSQAAIRAISGDIEKRFGGVARRQMLSLGVQSQKLQESFQQLFSGLKLEGFLGAVKSIADQFSQNTVTGRALKTIIEGLFQPILDFVTGHGILAKRFFQGLVIGALLLGIGVLKVRNALMSAFGDSSILKGLDGQRLAVDAGIFAMKAFAAALGIVGVSMLFAAAPIIILTAAIGAVVYGFYRAYKAVTSIDWAGAASALVDGFVNGITNGVQRVVASVKKLGTSALKALKDTLEIHSPSRVFMRAGVEIPRGMAQGVNRGASDVEAAVGGMAGGAAAAAPAPRGRVGRLSGGAPVIHLTIQIDGGKGGEQRSLVDDVYSATKRGLTEALEAVAIQMGAEVPA